MSYIKMALQAATFFWIVGHGPAWLIGAWAIYCSAQLLLSIERVRTTDAE